MEDLTNRQIVLLTMLTSFVVSTATGIITVAMLEEAPQTLTQTVNRVVERTIERVVTGTTTPEKPAPAPVTTVTKEVTIFAKEDDLIISAVEKNQPRIALIFEDTSATGTEPLSRGFVISRDGFIATDRRAIDAEGKLRDTYRVLIGSTYYRATSIAIDKDDTTTIAFLKLSELKASETLDAVSFGTQANPRVAQTVIVFGGGDGSSIWKTNLSKLRYTKTSSTSTATAIAGIEASPRIPPEYSGALVLNLDGQAVGIVIEESENSRIIYPSSHILDWVKRMQTAPPSATESKPSTPKGAT